MSAKDRLERRLRHRKRWHAVAVKARHTAHKAHDKVVDLTRRIRKVRAVIATRKKPVRAPAHATRYSPNKSSRGGVKPRVIVLHDTEGGYEGSIAWLCNPQAQASAHVIVSETGESTRLVRDEDKAWHVAADNPWTLGIEQEGYATQTKWPEAQLQTTAKWVALWSKRWGIPITHSTTNGVCQHSELGAAGGGHHDCGPHYPFGHVLALARDYRDHGW